MEYRRATLDDVDAIIDIIRKRIDWMDEMGLEQWNKTDYMGRYPREYFVKNNPYFIVACEGGKIMGVIAAYTEDVRWPDWPDHNRKAYYLHHLATLPEAKGLGRKIIAYCEELARQDGMDAIRFDSAIDNAKLTEYYESMGYPSCGTCRDGLYVGLLREKSV